VPVYFSTEAVVFHTVARKPEMNFLASELHTHKALLADAKVSLKSPEIT
jgi:hypothetical protein